ncbi:superoxide dismutase family protein [Tomitella biformata]|uniref:superoxide dismutase family protein n=1 Tax=Tomitella biformata TaxID=630403 RepID=UPI000467084F|nr:superoxide dismutase family protein [Tomitella biformata]
MSNSSQHVRQSRRLLAVVPVAVIAAIALSSCSAHQEPSDQPPGIGTLPPVFTPSPAPTASGVASTQDIGLVDEPLVVATLKSASGANVGTAEFQGSGLGTIVTLAVNGLTPGFHSLAVTSAGVCDAAVDFASAGDVLNDPTNSTPGVPKAGDLPTLLVDGDGIGTLTTTSGGFKVDELTNAPGTALVIGGDADASSRIACGVIEHK